MLEKNDLIAAIDAVKRNPNDGRIQLELLSASSYIHKAAMAIHESSEDNIGAFLDLASGIRAIVDLKEIYPEFGVVIKKLMEDDVTMPKMNKNDLRTSAVKKIKVRLRAVDKPTTGRRLDREDAIRAAMAQVRVRGGYESTNPYAAGIDGDF